VHVVIGEAVNNGPTYVVGAFDQIGDRHDVADALASITTQMD
jgi:hypothetical protein